MFYPHIEHRVYQAVLERKLNKPFRPIIVETDEEYRQALILLKRFGREDVEVKLERREDYEGEGFIVELE